MWPLGDVGAESLEQVSERSSCECQLCLTVSTPDLAWPGDSADSQLLPCLQGIPSASRQGELPQASLGRCGCSEVSPSPQHPSSSGLGSSGVRPVVNWEETWIVKVRIFIYLLAPPEDSLGSQQVIPSALSTCLVLEWGPMNLGECIPQKIPLKFFSSVFPLCPENVLKTWCQCFNLLI